MKKTIVLFAAAGMACAAFFLSSFSQKTKISAPNEPEPTFEEFLKQFPTQVLPYNLDEKTLQARLEQEIIRQNDPENYVATNSQRLSWQYHKFLPDLNEANRFSRMPVFAEPVASFETDENYAVMYLSGRGFSRNYGQYSVAVFDKEGKYVATYVVAGVSTTTLTTVTIDEKLQATTKTWQVNWEKNFSKQGLKDNKIVDLALLETTTQDLTAPVKIEKEEQEPQPVKLVEEVKEGTSE